MTREEAIDVLTLRKDMHEETAKALDMAIESLSEPKTGEWVKVIDEETPNVTKWHYECDQCGAGRFENGQRYCARCGADMRGDTE